MNIPDKKTLKKIIKVLQKIMGIRDWEIDIKLVTGMGMANNYPNDADCNTNGISDRNVRRNYALISINKEDPEDWYETLVHEMLHVQETIYVHASQAYMDKFGSYYEDIHEGYIDRLTRMFVLIYPHARLLKENENIFKLK